MSILDDSFKILEFYVKQTDQEFRLWGWLGTINGSYAAFWSLSGQKQILDFKGHKKSYYDIRSLSQRHLTRGFEKIELSYLRELWPTFDTVFEQNYTSFVLMNSSSI